MTQTMTGGCLCGKVRYTVEPTMRFQSYACHCTDCQRRSGSAFGIQQSVLAGDLIVEGELLRGEHVQPSGAVAGIYACKACLTRIYTDNNARPGISNLRAGTLDSSPSMVPAAHLWVQSKQPWVVIPQDAIAMDTQPIDTAGWIAIFKPEPA
ncbi:MAG: GFA family protein [Novosphingobium sp.]|uniref:GFA family protein n=1 Tax=Novosphingobium sp. TaxID=1874826 RepID=UPI0032BC9224